MEYMILLHANENLDRPAPGTAEFEAYMGPWFAFNQSLIDGGHWISGGSLQPTSTATTITLDDGSVTDGPYAETKEQLGGWYIITASDLDEALALGKGAPLKGGYVEVRPIAYRANA